MTFNESTVFILICLNTCHLIQLRVINRTPGRAGVGGVDGQRCHQTTRELKRGKERTEGCSGRKQSAHHTSWGQRGRRWDQPFRRPRFVVITSKQSKFTPGYSLSTSQDLPQNTRRRVRKLWHTRAVTGLLITVHTFLTSVKATYSLCEFVSFISFLHTNSFDCKPIQ